MIRRAVAGDTEEVIRLLTEVGNVHAELRPDLFMKDHTKYNAEELAEIFEDDLRPVFVFVNEAGKLCGYAFCMFTEFSGINVHTRKNIYIDDICVGHECRKEGVATALFEHVKKFAAENGCYSVTLNVWEGNEPARAFYEKKCKMQIQKTVMETIL